MKIIISHLVSIHFYTLLNLFQYTDAKVKILEFQMCDPNSDYAFQFNVTLMGNEETESVDGYAKLKIPLGDNVMNYFSIFTSLDGENFHKIFTIKETFCVAMKKYIGKFAHEIELAAGVPPGTCPVPSGNYMVKDHKTNFNHIKLKTFPKGIFKITCNMQDVETNAVLGCVKGTVELM